MQVTLDHFTPLYIASKAIRQCWASQKRSDSYTDAFCPTCNKDQTVDSTNICPSCSNDLSKQWHSTYCGENDKALIDRIGNKNKHASTLEHLYYNFTIEGVSRALLQELARHRISSLSVKSTRYTLKELKKELPFVDYNYNVYNGHITDEAFTRASKYLVFTGEDEIDTFSIRALENLRKSIGVYSNDIIKYCLPESYKTSLAWSINARSLQNFLSLRSSPHALWEIRNLANVIFEALPEDHKYLFSDCLVHDVQPTH